jgi:hypothetical protein
MVSLVHRAAYRSASSAAGAVAGSSRVVIRQNSSEVSVFPVLPSGPDGVVVTVYSMTRTVIRRPWGPRRWLR